MPHVSKIPKILDKHMEQIARAWARNYPGEFRVVMDTADFIRHHLLHDKAKSAEGLMMMKRVLTNRLEGVMNQIYGNNWTNDPDVSSAFDRYFKRFVINYTSVPKLDSKGGMTFRDGVPDESPDDEIVGQILAERA